MVTEQHWSIKIGIVLLLFLITQKDLKIEINIFKEKSAL